ncbi:hypothetical protein AAGT95_00270 [Salinicola lusitanus]|uniref:Uncharacterized protein n=1 Tax=Salinicola lusitanus TaxID=1949085 RepID=A0ABZ3CTC4_9GAMM
MRRRGASMTAATAMANPLSLPMAVSGTATYVLLSAGDTPLGAWYAGYVDLRALLALAVGRGSASAWHRDGSGAFPIVFMSGCICYC